MWKAVVAICVGASFGALLRWWLGLQLNALFPTIPAGTLAANLLGGYIIGLALAFFGLYSTLSPEWRLLIITGFCGSLTTFSTFSAEVVTLLQQRQPWWACATIVAHVLGSLTMTALGIVSVAWLKR